MPYIASQAAPPRWPYYVCYLVISAVGLYYMRLGPASQFTGVQLEPFFTSKSRFTYPGHPAVVMRRRYTGFEGIDAFLGMLVTAFLAGPAGFQKHIQLQQANFLFQFAPFIAVISLEAVRSRRWSLVVFTSLWASLYQTVGGAVIVPLYFVAHGHTFRSTDNARMIPASWAKTLLPAITLGYLLPTALMFYPFSNIDHTMLATAFWQPAPMLVNAVWAILKQMSSKTGSAATHIRTTLALVGTISAAVHIGTLYACFSPAYPSVSPSSIFLPLERRATSFEEAAHFIFQIDYLLIFLAMTLWLMQARSEDRGKIGKKVPRVVDAALLSGSVALLGPGATLSWVWFRRQERGGIKKE